ncbi:TPA: hypothetical protein N0F65_007307 [Lagenidium giganteum]|uniref:Superoxide dismutase [Fe] n=1 Tax=Lagenidium giganteum TaxID=4803 RepID=A0AAV2Z6F2_9STRA|nr:TPA: hypothetical protein N0F65_007307 [Lagenidium giganteum]
MTFAFPNLPYAYDALEPYVDTLTMNLHHTKHHQTYVQMANKLVQTEQGGELKNKNIVEVVQRARAEGIRNNAGGHYNHSLFWTWLAPPGTASTAPYGSLKDKIDQDFGSLDEMMKLFNAAAATRFGSGWAWLGVARNGKLGVTSTQNQDNPLMPDIDEPMIPILGVDVWEHSYFLKYQNRRPEYVRAFWKLVNWDQVVHCYDDFASKQKPVAVEMEDLPTPPYSVSILLHREVTIARQRKRKRRPGPDAETPTTTHQQTMSTEAPPTKEKVTFKLPLLKYDYNALEPYIDTLTMSIHHSMEHEVYVQFTNEYVEKYQHGELKGKNLVEVVQNAKAEPIRNNAGGHYNHSLFWTLMCSPGKAASGPSGKLKSKIEDAFGSVDRMKEEFTDVAAKRFGSGWAWLGVKPDGSLGITSTANQDNPLMPNAVDKMVPILGLDVWEHAYYLKYHNRRAEYIGAFWNVTNWDQVVANYDEFASKQQPIPIPGN